MVRSTALSQDIEALAVVLLVVLAVSFGATYGVYTLLSRPAEGLVDNQQLVPICRGDLVSQVSINGNLTFPRRTPSPSWHWWQPSWCGEVP